MEPARSCDTDKLQSGLAGVYESLFAGLKQSPVRLLEIGIDRGGSLALWAEFFAHERAILVGIDRIPPGRSFPPRVVTVLCDQNDTAGLRRIAAEYGPFDIVIDDGCHFAKETRLCFDTLFGPFVKVGGYYVIEDWAVGYWHEHRPDYAGMVEVVTEIIRQAPRLSVGEFVVSLKPGQAYAAFRKSASGWTA